MGKPQHTVRFRVRYSEVDQMGTFYNSRALEWFECGRVELLRAVGMPYAQMERRGVHLPVVETHVQYGGRAGFDDELEMTTTAAMSGKASVRFDMTVVHAATGRQVVRGYTLHAVTDRSGKCIRPPAWLVAALGAEKGED